MSNSTAAASDTVVVVVGEEQKHYTLHKRLLTFHSGYFHRVFKDGVSQCDLPTIHVEFFNTFVDWMYEKNLSSCSRTEDIAYMIATYITADDLLAREFKRILMDKVFDLLSNSHVPGKIVDILFDSLPKNDPLLQLTVDAFCINNGIANMSVDCFATIDDLPKEYLARVLRKQHQLSQLPEMVRVLAREDYSMVVCLA
jgi:hypothetical protein